MHDRPIDWAAFMDFSNLVAIRRNHESQRAAMGVRGVKQRAALQGNSKHNVQAISGPGKLRTVDQASAAGQLATATKNEQDPESMKQRLLREMQNIMREEHTHAAIGTGLERKHRWQAGESNVAAAPLAVATGNSANAALAAGQRATAVSASLPLL